MRYAFIRETLADRELYGMPLSERCRILGVSTSGYYEWLRRRNGRPRKKLHVPKRVMLSDETVLASVRRLSGLLGCTPGYRQFHELLLELSKARGATGWKRFAGHEAAVAAVAHWIHVYNHVRPHSSIAMKTPLEYEEDLATSKSVKPSA